MTFQESNTFDVFVSYSHHDAPVVRRITRRLYEHGADCFLDNWNLRVGDAISEELQKALFRSKAAIIFFSQAAIASPWCRLEHQWIGERLNTDKSFRALPVRLENCAVPNFASQVIYYDLFDYSDPSVIKAVRELTKGLNLEFKGEGVWGRTSILGDEIALRIERVVQGLSLSQAHSTLLTITSLLKRNDTLVRDAGECNCGGTVLCGYVNLGLSDWYSNFFHICTECLSHKHEEVFTGATQENGAERLCPWCKPLWFW